MPWKVVRIDFTDIQKCNFCNRRLRRGFGHVVVDENGNEEYSGPTCARNERYVTNPGEHVPNFTTGFLAQGRNEVNGNDEENEEQELQEQERVIGGGNGEENDRDNVIAYLLLRVKNLSDIYKLRDNRLYAIFKKYERNDLTDEDCRYVNNIIHDRERPEFSMQNLRALNYCKFIIQILIKRNERDADFLNSVKKYLYDKLALTNRQVNSLGNKLDNTQFELNENMFAIDPQNYWAQNAGE
ncbi:hypothetical protein [Morganella morganii]|uniref:hypothetical protein n=1 Tax=Morganella morganii TaxID=582 RepID=UPI00222FBEE6|nr:hypothetical protein [Morganella morganii]MDM8751841.1 hypothetical protein [Morganella morganii]